MGCRQWFLRAIYLEGNKLGMRHYSGASKKRGPKQGKRSKTRTGLRNPTKTKGKGAKYVIT